MKGKIKKKLICIYEIFYEKIRILRLRIGYRLNIMTPDQTIRYIKKQQCNIARYGDGEFDHILNARDEHFQVRDPELQTCLEEVLEINDRKLLVCIPRCMNTIQGCNEHAGSFWIDWGRNGHHEEIVNMIRKHQGKHYCFGDSQITRPYIDWKTPKRAERLFPKLRNLWKDRDIIIVEGNQTRMGIGNDLFDNAKSIKRILAPAEGAFSQREQIREAVLKIYNGELVLMALGPTATVLAADFAKINIWALDIGNIDIEYEWYLRKAKERIAIPGKYTNETKDGSGRKFSECKNEKYNKQIVKRINC